MQLSFALLIAPLSAYLAQAGPVEPGALLEMRDDNFCRADVEYPDKRAVAGGVVAREDAGEHLNSFGKRSNMGTCNWSDGDHANGIYGLCYKLEAEGPSGACRRMETPRPCPCNPNTPCPRHDANPPHARIAVLNQGNTNRNQYRPLCLYQDPAFVEYCNCDPYPPNPSPSPPASPQDKRSWIRRVRDAVTSRLSRA